MRSDMHKVVVERPRILRSSWRNKKTAQRLRGTECALAHDDGESFDSGATRASSSRHGKWFNENLAPLKRYLHKQVGRPWNKVYAEICQTLDTRSVIGAHVLQHIEDFVWTKTFLRDGVVYAMHRFGKPEPVNEPVRWWRGESLYVHPVTGLIRLTKPRPVEEKTVNITQLLISDTLQFEKRNEFWFRVESRVLGPDELVTLEDGRSVPAKQLPLNRRRVLVRAQQCDRKIKMQIERMIELAAKCPSDFRVQYQPEKLRIPASLMWKIE